MRTYQYGGGGGRAASADATRIETIKRERVISVFDFLSSAKKLKMSQWEMEKQTPLGEKEKTKEKDDIL